MGRWVAPGLASVVLVGVVAGTVGCGADAKPPKPRTLLQRLAHAALVDGDDACKPSNGHLAVVRGKPSARPDIYPRFAASARELTRVQCEAAGPGTFYVRFASHGDLTRALRLPTRQRPAQLCLFDHEVFDGDYLDPGQLRRWCAHLHGALRLYRAVPNLSS
jgi:hypothetical protein